MFCNNPNSCVFQSESSKLFINSLESNPNLIFSIDEIPENKSLPFGKSNFLVNKLELLIPMVTDSAKYFLEFSVEWTTLLLSIISGPFSPTNDIGEFNLFHKLDNQPLFSGNLPPFSNAGIVYVTDEVLLYFGSLATFKVSITTSNCSDILAGTINSVLSDNSSCPLISNKYLADSVVWSLISCKYDNSLGISVVNNELILSTFV